MNHGLDIITTQPWVYIMEPNYWWLRMKNMFILIAKKLNHSWMFWLWGYTPTLEISWYWHTNQLHLPNWHGQTELQQVHQAVVLVQKSINQNWYISHGSINQKCRQPAIPGVFQAPGHFSPCYWDRYPGAINHHCKGVMIGNHWLSMMVNNASEQYQIVWIHYINI